MIFKLEPIWFVAGVILGDLVTDWTSIVIARRIWQSMRDAGTLRTSLLWILANIVAIAALVVTMLFIIGQRPYVLVQPYHFYPLAVRQFWLYSLAPSLAAAPAIVLVLILLTASTKAFGSPILWFVERFLQRILETERGILTMVGGAITVLAGILNQAIRAGWL